MSGVMIKTGIYGMLRISVPWPGAVLVGMDTHRHRAVSGVLGVFSLWLSTI